VNEVVVPARNITETITLPPLIERAAQHVLTQAQSITIGSDEAYQSASNFGVTCRDERNRLDADRLKQTEKMRGAIADANEYFRGPIAMFDQAIEVTRARMNEWNNRKRLIAAEAQKKADDAKREQDRLAQVAREDALKKMQAAEAESRKAAEAETARAKASEEAALAAQRAAEAQAQGSSEEAAKAVQEADTAKADAAAERLKAKEAMKAKLRAEEQVRVANERADKAAAEAKMAAEALPPGGARGGVKVKGVRTRWVWKVKEGQQVPASHMKIDDEKIQLDVDRLKERAAEVFPWLEVTSEENATMRRGK
jgi:hypothetical protein